MQQGCAGAEEGRSPPAPMIVLGDSDETLFMAAAGTDDEEGFVAEDAREATAAAAAADDDDDDEADDEQQSSHGESSDDGLEEGTESDDDEEEDELVYENELFDTGAIESAEALSDQLQGFVPAHCRECAFNDSPLRVPDEASGCVRVVLMLAWHTLSLMRQVVHLSAPSIYATAMEALELTPGLSFLNVGSGSGYLSALVATIVSPYAVHHCIERCPLLAARCRDNFARMPLMRHAVVFAASAFDLDPDASMRYDRIYCGAGALASDVRFLARFLKLGGSVVGPFEAVVHDNQPRRSRRARPQCLVRATLTAPCELFVEELMPVQFTPLSREGDEPRAMRHRSTRSKLTLKGPVWGLDSPELFPPHFRLTVKLLHRAGRAPLQGIAKRACFAHAIPWHVWECRVLACLAYDDVRSPLSDDDYHVHKTAKPEPLPVVDLVRLAAPEIDQAEDDAESTIASIHARVTS